MHLSINTDLLNPNFIMNAMTDFGIVNFPFLDGHVPHSTFVPLTVFTFLNLFDLLECLVV